MRGLFIGVFIYQIYLFVKLLVFYNFRRSTSTSCEVYCYFVDPTWYYTDAVDVNYVLGVLSLKGFSFMCGLYLSLITLELTSKMC